MADDGKSQSQTTWPLVKFSFLVTIGNTEIMFQEVTGLNAETQAIEYRSGSSKVFSTVKMPGLKKYGNVTLKKGIFKDDKVLKKMYDLVVMNTFERQAITISVLDEKGGTAMSWALTNAFPCKMTVTDMKSDGNEAAVETMELAHEGLSLVS
ncbi:phage tail protein [Ferruginibacter sp. SUN106]|uniref:phage tail protein n=1 Tax=Ferruginibacter sp. SUN106 TaxID=2978348 RepID=UPI003D36A9D0